MSASLEQYVGHSVIIVSCDGRCFSGLLKGNFNFFFTLINSNFNFHKSKGFDQLINLVLVDTHERIFSTSAGMEQISLGLKIVRGDNVCVIGLVDEVNSH